MIDLTDPLDRLRAANPVLLTDPALAPPDPLLLHRITTGAVGLRPHPPRRRRGRLVPALAATSLLGGAAAYALLRGEVTQPQNVACYESADLRADTAVVSVYEEGAVAACAELWRRGVIGAGREVPPLVACVLGSGVAGVFPTTPGQDVCSGLDLPPVAPTTVPPPIGPGATSSDPNARVLAFRDAVSAQFVDSPCMDPADGNAIVRRELDRAGLTDWTIRVGRGVSGEGFSAQRPCASLLLLAEDKEVVLVASPRR